MLSLVQGTGLSFIVCLIPLYPISFLDAIQPILGKHLQASENEEIRKGLIKLPMCGLHKHHSNVAENEQGAGPVESRSQKKYSN